MNTIYSAWGHIKGWISYSSDFDTQKGQCYSSSSFSQRDLGDGSGNKYCCFGQASYRS